MPRLTSIVMVFIFVLLPLAGCGSSSPPIPEATIPPTEVIRLVNEKIRSLLIKTMETRFEYKESVPEIPKYKKLQLSDADKFNGITEEWTTSFIIIKEARYQDRGSSNWDDWHSRELKCSILVKKVKGEWVVGDRECEAKNNDNTFRYINKQSN